MISSQCQSGDVPGPLANILPPRPRCPQLQAQPQEASGRHTEASDDGLLPSLQGRIPCCVFTGCQTHETY